MRSSLAKGLERLERDFGDLVEAHASASRATVDYTSYKKDPVRFIEEVLGETNPGMWEAQRVVANAVYRNPLCAVASCNSAGKDWLAARLALWAAYSRDAFVLITGPTQRQVKENGRT